VDDVQGDDLAGGFLQLAELGQEVPEAGLGDHGIGGKDTHAVQFWGRVVVGGEAAADDLVFLEATWRREMLVLCVSWSSSCQSIEIRKSNKLIPSLFVIVVESIFPVLPLYYS